MPRALETSLVEWKHVFLRQGHSGRVDLGNFLSGMETPAESPNSPACLYLGNFLSGMETRPGEVQSRGFAALETSLVEWKRHSYLSFALPPQTLETSLVEWKRWLWPSCPRCGGPLGNFLSGMETGRRPRRKAPAPALETSLVEWKLYNLLPVGRFFDTLETSLVEWKPWFSTKWRRTVMSLGNFLSGMETWSIDVRVVRGAETLETSLVEWKHRRIEWLFAQILPLETSLVEWKRDAEEREKKAREALGNFLSGMETRNTP